MQINHLFGEQPSLSSEKNVFRENSRLSKVFTFFFRKTGYLRLFKMPSRVIVTTMVYIALCEIPYMPINFGRAMGNYGCSTLLAQIMIGI